jgi:hypothetical protein
MAQEGVPPSFVSRTHILGSERWKGQGSHGEGKSQKGPLHTGAEAEPAEQGSH